MHTKFAYHLHIKTVVSEYDRTHDKFKLITSNNISGTHILTW